MLQSIWGLDCNMFPHFLIIAIDLLLIGLSNKKILYISMIAFALTLYCYGVAIYFVPLFLLIISIYLLKKKYINKKDLVICVIIFIAISAPIIMMFAINGLHIEQDIKIGNITIPYYENLSRTDDMVFFSEKPFKQLIDNICSTFKVIFTQKDGTEWNAPKLFGTTYRITSLFAIIGIIKVIKLIIKKENTLENIILIMWLGSCLIIGFIVKEVNINRLNSLWYLILIYGTIGIYEIYEKIKFKKIYKILIITLYLILFIIFTIYFHKYYVKIVDQSGCFSRGFYQTLNYVKNIEQETILYDNIKDDGCLELYIKFNNNNTKNYKEINIEENLKEKINNIDDNEVLIVDVEYRDYGIKSYDKKIGDFIIITK